MGADRPMLLTGRRPKPTGWLQPGSCASLESASADPADCRFPLASLRHDFWCCWAQALQEPLGCPTDPNTTVTGSSQQLKFGTELSNYFDGVS
eukprot:scaffold237742_cov22-Prasinocladus_malaysianus.AAC.1